ncbi:hypothetical protein [uncultured Winogradskyella sp.]|uniref:hypothetical protein n=1 Tax=uncultured Winogradskyella sp. TaxID=395353 RepID=UPI00260B8CCD|nr:hypothetical protein [uncultured Winogradskyella sp.]
MKLKTLARLIIVIFFVLSCSKNSEQIELKLSYDIGDKQTITSTTETSKGTLMSIKNVMETDFEVTSIENNEITFKTRVNRIITEMKMDNEIEKYDSNKDISSMTGEEKSMHSEYQDILDAKLNIIIDDKGKVTKSFHHDDGNLFNEPVVDIRHYFLSFPDNKVGVGSIWQNENTNPITNQKTKSTYKIEDITNKEIIISIDLKIAGMPGLLGDNSATGHYVLNRASCKLIKGALEMDLQTGGSVTNSYISM